jgi:hypothetical protein
MPAQKITIAQRTHEVGECRENARVDPQQLAAQALVGGNNQRHRIPSLGSAEPVI